MDTVEFRQRQVENDEVGSLTAGELESGKPVGRLEDNAVVILQPLGERGSRRGIVFDHQDTGPGRGGLHFFTIAGCARIERPGGTFTFATGPGRGTTIRAQVCKRDHDSHIAVLKPLRPR